MEKRSFKYCCDDIENVENYEKAKADNFKGWICHHRLETHNSDGERRLVDISYRELKALDMYYHRPAEELIFLTKSEHFSLHRKGKPAHNKGVPMSEEQRKKMDEFYKSGKNRFYGKKHSEQTKNKMSDSAKGKHLYNNGKICIRAYKCPPGFVPGMLKRK